MKNQHSLSIAVTTVTPQSELTFLLVPTSWTKGCRGLKQSVMKCSCQQNYQLAVRKPVFAVL